MLAPCQEAPPGESTSAYLRDKTETHRAARSLWGCMPEQTRSTRSPSCCQCPYRWVIMGQAAAHRTGQHLTPSCLLHQSESEPWCNAEMDFQQFTASPLRKDFHSPKIIRMTTKQLLSISVFAWLKCLLREVTFPKTSLSCSFLPPANAWVKSYI